MSDTQPVGRAFFERKPLLVAFDLLGCQIVSTRYPGFASGRVVEVEAYGGTEDLASHAGKYEAGRIAMGGRAGLAYVYRSYGIHAMLNVVAHEKDMSGAVLIRALEPNVGTDVMRLRRAKGTDRELCMGPGRLGQALAIRLIDNGIDLVTSKEIWIELGESPPTVLRSKRIGISVGKEAEWRLFDGDSVYVSPPRRGTACVKGDILTDADLMS